ncbi:MAG TPA: 5-oxoprolinase subunit PxpB [Capsulimonadaceae bacterium]|jgi:inhibitor of KinA
MNPQYKPLGDRAVRIEFANPFGTPDPAVNRLIRAFCLTLAKSALPGVVEWVPAYATVAVMYDPLSVSFDQLVARLQEVERRSIAAKLPPPRTIAIPVVYGGEFGEDLPEVATSCNLTEEDVVRLHESEAYLVYMLGFVPGFPYLGGLNPRLATERRAIPRTAVPPGSVGLAGNQTGVYPFATPGGWNIIGRTNAKLYDPAREPAALLVPGDYVRFVAADKLEDTR